MIDSLLAIFILFSGLIAAWRINLRGAKSAENRDGTALIIISTASALLSIACRDVGFCAPSSVLLLFPVIAAFHYFGSLLKLNLKRDPRMWVFYGLAALAVLCEPLFMHNKVAGWDAPSVLIAVVALLGSLVCSGAIAAQLSEHDEVLADRMARFRARTWVRRVGYCLAFALLLSFAVPQTSLASGLSFGMEMFAPLMALSTASNHLLAPHQFLLAELRSTGWNGNGFLAVEALCTSVDSLSAQLSETSPIDRRLSLEDGSELQLVSDLPPLENPLAQGKLPQGWVDGWEFASLSIERENQRLQPFFAEIAVQREASRSPALLLEPEPFRLGLHVLQTKGILLLLGPQSAENLALAEQLLETLRRDRIWRAEEPAAVGNLPAVSAGGKLDYSAFVVRDLERYSFPQVWGLFEQFSKLRSAVDTQPVLIMTATPEFLFENPEFDQAQFAEMKLISVEVAPFKFNSAQTLPTKAVRPFAFQLLRQFSFDLEKLSAYLAVSPEVLGNGLANLGIELGNISPNS